MKLSERLAGFLKKVAPEGAKETVPSIEQELGTCRELFHGKVLHAAAGNRDISPLIDGQVINQDDPNLSNHPNIHISSPLHQMPVNEGEFDAVICSAFLDHLNSAEAILEEFNRVAKHEAILYLGIWGSGSGAEVPAGIIDELPQLVEKYGFRLINKEDDNNPVVASDSARIIAKKRFQVRNAPEWLKKAFLDYADYEVPAGAYGKATANELSLLSSYGRRGYEGKGKIFVLGADLGATTLALTKGLSESGRQFSAPIIESFGSFKWDGSTKRLPESKQLPGKYAEGGSVLPQIEKILQPYQSLIRLHQDDLTAQPFPEEPIEMLYVGGVETWPFADKITRLLLPLVVEGGFVAIENFVSYDSTPSPIQLIMWNFREYFIFTHHVPESGTVLFQCKKHLDSNRVPRLGEDFFTPEMTQEADKYISRFVTPLRLTLEK